MKSFRIYRPEGFDLLKPNLDPGTETTPPGVFPCAKLPGQSYGTRQRNLYCPSLHHPTLPDNPQVEIKNPWRMRQTRNYVTLHWDAIRIDFLLEAFAQSDDIAVCPSRILGLFRVEP